MSIKSTKRVTREFAINRITLMVGLAKSRSYRKIEEHTSENSKEKDCIPYYCSNIANTDISNIENWTNTMLEESLDLPLIRESMFDNYQVVEDDG